MRKNKGFSLIELIVVIAIIAVLAAIITPVTFHYLQKAKVSQQETNVKNLYTELNLAVIQLYSSNTKFNDSNPPYYGAENGASFFVDSVTGKKCGLVTSSALNKKMNGTGSFTEDEGIIIDSLYDAIGGRFKFSSINPSGALVSSLANSQVNIMIVYNESGLIRIEYANQGLYTTFDGRTMETVDTKKDDNSNTRFNQVD